MRANQVNQRTRLTWPALISAAMLAAVWLPASAQFIASNRTVAGGNPLNATYGGQPVIIGASAIVDGSAIRVANVRVDVVASAQFNFSDATGGYFAAYSNSVLTMSGGIFGPASSFANVGRLSLADTSRADISGGQINGLTVDGSAAGAAGARATISGGTVGNSAGVAALVQRGTLDMSGGSVLSNGGQPGIYGFTDSVISLSGGTVQSATGQAVLMGGNGVLTMTGGTATGGTAGGAQWGVRLDNISITAMLRGGTVNGGVRTEAASNPATTLQARFGGSVSVNGGVFAYGNAALDVTGGSYTRFAGADASFFAMGTNTINFFGTGLTLSEPEAGQVFETNDYTGNFYTFTGGSFSDGQSAVGLRLFDAVSVAGNQLVGGFTLNAAPVPEPAPALLLLLALPIIGVAARKRCCA